MFSCCRKKFQKVKADQLLLAAAVIGAAAFMVQQDKADEVISLIWFYKQLVSEIYQIRVDMV